MREEERMKERDRVRQIERQTDRQRNRQIDREIYRDRERERFRERERGKESYLFYLSGCRGLNRRVCRDGSDTGSSGGEASYSPDNRTPVKPINHSNRYPWFRDRSMKKADIIQKICITIAF